MWSDNVLPMFEAHASFLISIIFFSWDFSIFFSDIVKLAFSIFKSFLRVRFEVKPLNFGLLHNFLTIDGILCRWMA
jgi:hypothetical protein